MPKSSVLRSSNARSVQPAPSPVVPHANSVRPNGRNGSAHNGAGESTAPTISELERRLPTHAEIAARAFHLSEARRQSGEPGDEMSDWLQAEAELVGLHS